MPSLILVDVITMAIAVALAGLLRANVDDQFGLTTLAGDRHTVASVLTVPLLLVVFRLHGLYDPERILVGTREYMLVLQAVCYSLLIALAASYFAGQAPLVSRSWLLLVGAMTIVAVEFERFAMRRVVRHLRRGGRLRTRIAIVGASTTGVAIARQLSAHFEAGYDVVGFLDEYLPLHHRLVGDIAVVGRPRDLMTRGSAIADEFIVVPQALPHQRLEEISHMTSSDDRLRIRMAVSSMDLLTHGLTVRESAGVPLVTLQRARLTGVDAALKRIFDVTVGSAGLLVLGPLALAAIARARVLGVRPLVEHQRIQGLHGRQGDLPLLTHGVTTWLPARGAPALIAVLKGDVSIVGPRPRPSVGGTARQPRSLAAIRPGLTGPWRMSGPDAALADQETRDLLYVRNYTIWEDIRIVWETVQQTTLRRSARLGRWQLVPARQPRVASPTGGSAPDANV